MAKKYIDAEKLIAEIERQIIEHKKSLKKDTTLISEAMLKGSLGAYESIESFITSLQQDQPDKETILRICKLHKVWSITAPWENVEDFITTNWNSENIV